MQMRLALGESSCNMHCSYCRAMHNVPRNFAPPKDKLNKAKIIEKTEPVKHEIERFGIWGGEPLLDFNRFQEAVELIKEVLTDKPIHIVTNGTMLKFNHIVDYIIANNIQLTISHDAYNQHLRGSDFLQDPAYIDNLSRLHSLNLHSVLHRHNLDFKKIEEYYRGLADKYGWNIVWSHEMYKVVSPESYQYACTGNDFAKLRSGLDYAVREMVKGNPFFASFNNILKQILSRLTDNKSYRCGMNNNFIINHKGERLLCQVQSETNETIQFGLGQIPARCSGCPVAFICRGYCPLIPDEYRRLNCAYSIVYYDQILQTAISIRGEVDADN